MSNLDRVPPLGLHFAILSLMAVGGVNATMPEIHSQVVEATGWMTSREFAELYAVAQAAPGPNMMVATVIGWRVAGGWGALVATLAMCTPSSIGVYFAQGWWRRVENKPWRAWVQAGVAPVVIGLVGSTGYLLAKGADVNGWGVLLTGASAAVTWRTRLNPLWLLACGAVLGVAGVV
jgi:chromate transporter